MSLRALLKRFFDATWWLWIAPFFLLVGPLDLGRRLATSPILRRLRRAAFGPVTRARREGGIWTVTRWIWTSENVAPPILERAIDPGSVVKARWYAFRQAYPDGDNVSDILELELRDGERVVLRSKPYNGALADLIAELRQSGVLCGGSRSISEAGATIADFALFAVWSVILFVVILVRGRLHRP
jgi:hypothetical protein